LIESTISTVPLAQCVGKTVDAICADGQIGTAAAIGRDHLDIGYRPLIRIVDDFGKAYDV
jgi:hypothetical protein